ncbi:MAG: propanoyl-CoA acyltransferase [Elusimicrobia bacterium]|nr:MAG: propanoyl-CoA acyltransferase [Elusimicrobiota bacterium]
MANRVAIVGVGQTHHTGRRLDVTGVELINEAVQRALEDAQLTRDDIDGVVIGNMDHFEGINGVECWSILGNGGLNKPTIKLTTGGTTGSTLAMGGYHMTASGYFEKLLVIGWEKNSESDTTGAITTAFDPIWDRPVFAGAVSGLAAEARFYMNKFGVTEKDAARAAVRDRKHGANNPYAHMRKEVSLEQVMRSPMLADPIKAYDMCPRTDGACALIYAAEGAAEKICKTPAWIHTVTNRHLYSYLSDTEWYPLVSLQEAAKEAYSNLGVKEPLKEFDVMELYTPYSMANLSWIEALGLAKQGEGARLIEDGATEMNGVLPINPSGGVISTNPIGATGLIRAGECALQIMGRAGARQVQGAKKALSTGFGGCMWSDLLIYGADKPN